MGRVLTDEDKKKIKKSSVGELTEDVKQSGNPPYIRGVFNKYIETLDGIKKLLSDDSVVKLLLLCDERLREVVKEVVKVIGKDACIVVGIEKIPQMRSKINLLDLLKLKFEKEIKELEPSKKDITAEVEMTKEEKEREINTLKEKISLLDKAILIEREKKSKESSLIPQGIFNEKKELVFKVETNNLNKKQ